MTKRYVAIIHKDPDSSYGVQFPDVAGCFSGGETLEEARTSAREALRIHLESMAADGEPIPEPSPIDEVAALVEKDEREDPSEGTVFLLEVEPEVRSKPVRINITVDERLLSDVDRAAETRGMTRSGFLAEAARRFMGG